MQLQPINSSTIAAVGYDAETKELVIQFKNSGVYRYSNVPQEAFDGLSQTKSAGSYFAAQIRGKFESTKVPPPAQKVPA